MESVQALTGIESLFVRLMIAIGIAVLICTVLLAAVVLPLALIDRYHDRQQRKRDARGREILKLVEYRRSEDD